MKKLAINPNNKRYYSDEYIKGWEDGAKAQYEATKDAVEVVRCKDCMYENTCCRNVIDDYRSTVPSTIEWCSHGLEKIQTQRR